jgi:IS1 family transposase
MLLEGNSIRSTSRLTGHDKNAIMDTMVEVGVRCAVFLDGLRELPAQDVQADELWAFCRMKEKTRLRLGRSEEYGDVWCFLAIERTSKLILAHHVGKRSQNDTLLFAEKLRRATRPARFQLSTDGFTSYPAAIWSVFGPQVDYGTIVKVIGPTAEEGTAGRYSPGSITAIYKDTVIGNPDNDKICTSHVERQNKTLRMQIRRYTRLTDAHSKKLANHEAMVALFFAYYNYCRPHATLTKRSASEGHARRLTTPAMAAGLTDHVWSMEELLQAINNPAT